MPGQRFKPAFEAFLVDGDGEGAQWTKIGAAWKHEDGLGYNLTFTPGLAVSGKVVLRPLRGSQQAGQ